MTALEIVGLLIAVIALIVATAALYWGALYPRFVAPKPNVRSHTNPHWTSADKNQAVFELVIDNDGAAPARGVGVYFEIAHQYALQDVASTPSWSTQTGGVGGSMTELHWNELSPGNVINVRLTYPASEDPRTLYPAKYKVWYKDRLVNAFGA